MIVNDWVGLMKDPEFRAEFARRLAESRQMTSAEIVERQRQRRRARAEAAVRRLREAGA